MGTRGIAHVGLKVSNVKKSRQFYREILGLKDHPQEPGIVYIPTGKDLIVLYGKGAGSSSFHFGFSVNSPSQVDKWRDWFRSKKVAIHEDETEERRRSIKIRDPDGHWIEISYDSNPWHPSWTP